LWLCALCLPLVAQEPSFKDVHIDKKPGQTTGRALVTIDGKVRRIATRALEAWPIMNGQNALILWLDPKAAADKYRLRFIEGATRKRRELGALPFSSAKLIEREHDGNWVFVLAGTNGADPALIVADTDGIHGEIHSATDPKIESGTLSYRDPRGETKTVTLDAILARDMRGIYKFHESQFVQFNRDGTAVLAEQNGQFQTGVWRTDGLVLTIVPQKGRSLRFPRNTLVPADGVSAGTRLAVRLLHSLDSRKVDEGDAVRTVLISPAFVDGRILIPQGSEISGTIVKAHGVGWGLRHETAALTLDLREAKLPDGRLLVINTRLYQVENSRESVDSTGAIRGIRSTNTLGHSAESKISSIAAVDPVAYLFTSVSATAVLGFAEPEILYPAGTEMIIEFTSPLITSHVYPPKAPPLTPTPGAEDLNAFLRRVPFRTMTKGTNKPSDLTNLLFIGSPEGLRRAFHAAGWVTTDQLTAGSTFQTLKTLSGNQTYREAPMSTLLLDERPPVFTLTKTTNTFSSRHHLRVFDPALRYGGETVLTSSSTQDIGIAFSRKQKTFIHVIDQYIDNERSKVVNDLKYTGCVDAMELFPRPWAPRDAYNSTGDKLRTDGAIAVLRINDCAHPTTTPDDDAVPPPRLQRVTRDAMLAVRNDLWRGNLVYQGVTGTMKLRSYLRTKDELKPDAGAWRKADLSGTEYEGARASAVPFDQQPAARVDHDRGGPPAAEPPPEPSHRWDPPRYEIGLQGGYLRYPTVRTDGTGILAIPKDLNGPIFGVALADEVEGGWTAGISLTSNTWRWVSNEFSYQYQRGKYELGEGAFEVSGEDAQDPDITTERVGLITRQFEYNVLIHLRPPESRWRPYVAVGPVLQLISLADAPVKKPAGPFKLGAGNIGILKAAFDFGSTPPLEGGGIFQLGLQYGAGIKFRVHPRITLRADFRETWSKNPEFIRDSYTKDFFTDEDFDVTFIRIGPPAKFRQQRFTLGVAFTF
jgi:hypothetical protein